MITIKVLKDGHPVRGITVSYTKKSMFGGSGSPKITDAAGCVSYNADPGHACVHIKGKTFEQYLAKGENVFHIWYGDTFHVFLYNYHTYYKCDFLWLDFFVNSI